MKISRFCAFSLLLILVSTLAFADGIQDPKVIIKGAGGGNIAENGKCGQCIGVGFNFSFTIPEGGSGNLFFTNESGKAWNSLALFVTGVPASSISCHSEFFASCVTKTLKNGSVEILFSNGKTDNKDRGIPNGGNFQISFACVKGTCWPGGITVTGRGSAGTLPEPATLALMTTGLGAIIARRKVKKNRLKS